MEKRGGAGYMTIGQMAAAWVRRDLGMQEENENLKEEDSGPPLTCSFYGLETTIMERRARILFGFCSCVPLYQWQCQETF